MAKAISEKLFDRIKAHPDLCVKNGAFCQRLYTGHWQRSEGAWVWEVANNGLMVIGSVFTMRECLKAHTLDILEIAGYYEIFPKGCPGEEVEDAR